MAAVNAGKALYLPRNRQSDSSSNRGDAIAIHSRNENEPPFVHPQPNIVHCPPLGCFPGFVRCFLGVPQLVCSFPAAKASKKNSQRIVYKTYEAT